MLKICKLKKIKYKICICLFLLYLISFLKRNLNYIAKIFRVHKNVNLSHFEKSNLIYPKLDEIKLNYSGKCGEIFKYKQNNKRDLVFFSYKYTKYYLQRSYLIYNVIDSFKEKYTKRKNSLFCPRRFI